MKHYINILVIFVLFTGCNYDFSATRSYQSYNPEHGVHKWTAKKVVGSFEELGGPSFSIFIDTHVFELVKSENSYSIESINHKLDPDLVKHTITFVSGKSIYDYQNNDVLALASNNEVIESFQSTDLENFTSGEIRQFTCLATNATNSIYLIQTNQGVLEIVAYCILENDEMEPFYIPKILRAIHTFQIIQ